MSERGLITMDGGGAAAPSPKRGWVPAVAVGVVVAAAAVVAGFGALGGSGGSQSLGGAVGAVEDFADAWNRTDVAALDEMIDGEWYSVALPGFVDPWFTPDDGRPALVEALVFLSEVADLSLGECTAGIAPADSPATALVRCRDARFTGDYLEAVRRQVWYAEQTTVEGSVPVREPGLTFGTRRGRIVTITDEARDLAPQAYCIWAEQTAPEAAGPLFDLHCRPATNPHDALAHGELAGAFIEAGAPLPSIALVRSRLAAAYVDRFVEHQNLGDTLSTRQWLAYDVRPGDLPGFAGGDADAGIGEFLLWSTLMVEIETGECLVEFGEGDTIVTCPDMTVSGPLLDEPHPQPFRFTVAAPWGRYAVARAFDRIVAVEPLGERLSVEDVCGRLERLDPAVAAQAFTEDCAPVYTREAAHLVLGLLGGA